MKEWLRRILGRGISSTNGLPEAPVKETAKPPIFETRFATDVATLAVFDPARLRHRLDDDVDWLAAPDLVILEANQGNALLVQIGADGVYTAAVHLYPPPEEAGLLRAILKSDTGRFYVGSGEGVPADDYDPTADPQKAGSFVSVPPGNYEVFVGWSVAERFEVYLVPSQAPAENSFRNEPTLLVV
jgi:hypothetical protein